MDTTQYNTLVEAMEHIPDPRRARGKRYVWSWLLSLICSALAAGQRTPHAIAHWLALHKADILDSVDLRQDRMPSESTLRRVMRVIDVQTLEQSLTEYARHLAPSVSIGTITTAEGTVLQGQAVDGKDVRGAGKHGRAVHLVSLVQHGSGLVLGQIEVERKTNEIPMVPQLLAGRDLSGIVITADALHTHAPLAQQILDQQGQYVMIVKENQGTLYQAIALLFDQPPWLQPERASEYQVVKTITKGHGRRETRILESSPSLNDYIQWPGLGQVWRRQCERLILKTGELTRETTYGITSLRPEQATAAQLERLCRGHWTIENRVHYVRDVSMGEDAGQAYTGHTPHVLAALRNAVLNLFRVQGWTNIADALRYYGASTRRALTLVGLISPEL